MTKSTLKRFVVEVKYKAFVVSTITLDAEDEEDAVKSILDNMDTEKVEELEFLTVKELDMPNPASVVEAPAAVQ